MWSNLQEVAKKAAQDATAAAKMVSDNEHFQTVAGKVKKNTKKVTSKVKTRLVGDSKKNEETKEQVTAHASPKSRRPFAKIQADAAGVGDMSEITWADGSVRSVPSLRVFGKDTTIVVADDLKVSKRRKGRDSGDNLGSSIQEIPEDGNLTRDIQGDDQPEQQSPPSHPKVNLPVLIFPGMASSGLKVEESGLDNKKYQGRRLWMNAGFLAASAMDNTVVSSDITNAFQNHNSYIAEGTRPSGSFVGNVQDLDRDTSKTSGDNDDSESDEAAAVEFAKIEDELQIRSAWLYHIALDKNMVDERPGNKVRTYDGIKACEWLVDDALGKSAAVVWADTIAFLEREMGYVRGKNLDAAPYDWRLPPMCTEARDGHLTKTIEKVENLYKESGGLPIVMCCHSMGCKMGHYFLNFCLKEKGREWIDKHIHTYMPVGAPHCGAPLTLKLGATGAGLLGLIDDVMISLDEGLIMYRSWGSGPWLIPRELPPGIFPPCIVRREGELGIKISSEINVASLFADREKPPRELRLTIIYRNKIQASTDFVPLKTDSETNSMIVSFDETFYLAVPYLEEGKDDLGSLVFFLEEPSSGGLYQGHQNKTRTQLRNATKWARGFKKEVTKLYRSVAKKIGSVLQVAVCEKPLELKISSFADTSSTSVDGSPVIESVVPFCKCEANAKKTISESKEDPENDDGNDALVPYVEQQEERAVVPYVFDNAQHTVTIGSLSIHLRYTPPPDFQKNPSTCTTKFAVLSEDTPIPPVVSRKKKSSTTKGQENIIYEPWHGKDLFDQDGFLKNMFDVHEEYYEQDPLGPTTKSAQDAPPVNIVRSIYGINVPTEISAVYRKEPVVTIGDSKADCRYRIDTSAGFAKFGENSSTDPKDQTLQLVDPRVEEMLKGYHMKDGIIEETSETLQEVPGTTEKRRCCGDGTVPYWSLVHCLKWKDSIPTVTVDELDGAIHRSILSDKRFHALLQQHCTVDDPRLPTTALTTIQSGFSGLGLATIPDTGELKSYT